jgi:uncharacterized protein
MDEPIRRVDAAAARRFLVRRHLLAPPRALPASLEGVRSVFARIGSIQFDPLGVAGRNHDLVPQARVAGYRMAWADALLYDTRELYETYNKGLSLVPTRELPWYRIHWERALLDQRVAQAHERRETMEHVVAEIRRRGPLSTAEFERHRTAGTVDWFWGPTNEIRAALEALWEAGILALHHRDGNRRFYDLAERIYPPELLAERPSPVEQRRHKLLSRYRAHGLLGTGGQAELWLGTATTKPVSYYPSGPFRDELREALVTSGELVPVQVEGVRGPRFVVRADVPLLDSVTAGTDGDLDASVSFLAPLDPFVWDRDLMRQLFGFDYLWEVYVPEAKRRWGYHVLPLLFEDRLVGRIEPRGFADRVLAGGGAEAQRRGPVEDDSQEPPPVRRFHHRAAGGLLSHQGRPERQQLGKLSGPGRDGVVCRRQGAQPGRVGDAPRRLVPLSGGRGQS